MELIERVARVIAGYRLSANADGAECSAADAVDALWVAHQDEAVAIIKSLRDPSPTMVETGMGAEWSALIDREIATANAAADSRPVMDHASLTDRPEPEGDATGSGRLSPPGLDDDMDFERRNPGSGSGTH